MSIAVRFGMSTLSARKRGIVGVVLVPRHRAGWAADQVAQVIEKEEALRRRIVAARSAV